MTDLVEFLLARIAEDEAVARDAASEGTPPRTKKVLWTNKVSTTPGGERLGPRGTVEAHPARVLAECEAKKAIVEAHNVGDHTCRGPEHATWVPDCYTLRALALPFADHPDYDETWRP